MKKCPNCGAVNRDDYRFCNICGCRLEESASAQGSSSLRGSMGGTSLGEADRPETPVRKDAPPAKKGFLFEPEGESGGEEISGSFKGSMGGKKYRHTSSAPASGPAGRGRSSHKLDAPGPEKPPRKPGRGWLAWAVAAVVVVAIAVPVAVRTIHRGGEAPATAQAYRQFGSELAELTERYGYASEQDAYSSCRLLVSCEDSVDIDSLGAAEVLQSPDGVYVLQYENKNDAIEANKKLSSMRGVEYAEPDILISTDNTGAAGANPISWGTTSIGADVFANQLSRKNHTRVTVAIVDSGVSEHEFLRGRLLNGWDFIGNDADPTDEKSHGTHVAGIVVDATQGLDIALLPVRVLNEQGKGPSSVVGNGIRYAADCGVDIINLSLGGGHSSYIDDAVSYALAKGVIVVVSAGNDSTQTEGQCPAHIDGCITVSAVDQNLSLAGFSNYGGAVDFCAPGVGIYSSVLNNQYGFKQGTSMATPYISALAAMLKASGMAATPNDVEAVLASCALDLGVTGRDPMYGYGLPQMDALLREPAPEEPAPEEPAPEEPVVPPVMPVIPEETLGGTYWMLQIGWGVGSYYELRFGFDGTYEAYNYGGDHMEGTYDVDEISGYLYLDGTAFEPDGDGFISVETYFMSGGPSDSHYTLSLSSVERFEENRSKATIYITPSPTPVSPESSLWDGEYTVRLSKDSFYTDCGYICAEAEWMLPMSFDEEFVYSLEPGDIIDLTDYGFEDIIVTDVRFEQGAVAIMDDRSPVGYYFYYNHETGLYELNQGAGSGYWPYIASIEMLVFSEYVRIHEETFATEHYLSDPRDADFESAGGKRFANIVIDNGLVTKIDYVDIWY